MPTLTTNANNLNFTAANQQWIVQSGVVVGWPNNLFGAVVMPFPNDELINNGILFVPQGTPFGGSAVTIQQGGTGGTVTNTVTGSMTAPTGINVLAGGIHVANAGSIVGFAGNGLSFSTGVGPTIDNSGYLYGQSAGIVGTLIDSFTLTNSGVIASANRAIVLLVSGSASITNNGKIKAADGSDAIIAPVVGSGSVQVVNQGVIRGDVELSSGADTYDGRGGTIKGTVFGDGGNDMLTGGGRSDELEGEGGQDTITGGRGGDTLVGGAAGDTLKGGGGGDDYVYTDVSDSNGTSTGTRDTILSFTGSDRIDLRPLDAKLGGGNQKFDFIGTSDFTGKKGQLRYEVDDGDAIVQADVTGNGKADLAILVSGVTKLSAGDFIL